MGKVIKQNTGSSNILEYHENKLKGLGYKFTKSRRIIMRVLSEDSKLLDADSIYMLAKSYEPKVGIATVYRTLELLTRLNLICRIILGSEKSYYMLSKDCRKETSIYMICDNCKRIIANNKCLNSSIKIRLRDDAEENILKNCKIKIDNYQVFFTGLCDKCSKQL